MPDKDENFSRDGLAEFASEKIEGPLTILDWRLHWRSGVCLKLPDMPSLV